GGVLVLAAVGGAGILAITRGFRPDAPDQGSSRLADVLSKTIETRGIDASVAQYRALREQGFPGLRESESDTNRLGYRLLGKGESVSAIEVFRLNVGTQPGSANVHDSLGEAYLTVCIMPLA